MRERIAMKVARFVPGREGTSNLSFLFNLGKPYLFPCLGRNSEGATITKRVEDSVKILCGNKNQK